MIRVSIAAAAPRVIDAPIWRDAAEAHRARMLSLIGGSLNVDLSNPIYNFIFVYYSFDQKLLLRYSPGAGVVLKGVGVKEEDLWTGRGYVSYGDGSARMDPMLCKPSMRNGAVTAASIMRATSGRAPHLNCYGLHEWAMLYQPPGSTCRLSKYQELPLRVSQAELNAVVESMPLACTHFDAFRFFTAPATPLNTISPTPSRATQAQLEQPGCVHASMDLFRYSLKLWPWLPAELLADTLELAVAARVLDMRASPYDLSQWQGGAAGSFDLSPVRIETAEGRKLYQREQSRLASWAQPLRARLLREYDSAIAVWESAEAERGSTSEQAETGLNVGESVG